MKMKKNSNLRVHITLIEYPLLFNNTLFYILYLSYNIKKIFKNIKTNNILIS